MVINKKPNTINKKTPAETNYPQASDIVAIAPISEKYAKASPGLIKTGSPTTGDSGLVTSNVTPNKKVKRVTRKPQIRTQLKPKPEIVDPNQLRVSQKRILANDLMRKLRKYDTVLDKTLKLIINRNGIQDPIKQDVSYGIEVTKDGAIIKVRYTSARYDTALLGELKKNIKNIEVTPFSEPSPGETGFYIRTK